MARYMNSHGFTAYETPVVIQNKSSDFVPYIYSDAELSRIFTAADGLPSFTNCPNRGAVVSLIFRLIYGCGLRISEALNLKMKDVDLDDGILAILESKFEKSRYVPMASALTERCKKYVQATRKDTCPEDWFFPAPDGSQYSRKTIEQTFRRLLFEAGMPYIPDMILWIEDLNWPGAEQIQQRLIEFQDVSMLTRVLNSVVPALEKLKKPSWLMFLSDLLNNRQLSQAINDSTKEILMKYSRH